MHREDIGSFPEFQTHVPYCLFRHLTSFSNMATTTCLILLQPPNLLPLQEMAVDDNFKVDQVEMF